MLYIVKRPYLFIKEKEDDSRNPFFFYVARIPANHRKGGDDQQCIGKSYQIGEHQRLSDI